MDNTRRAQLQNQREIIVRDLDVRYILDALYSENAIELDEKDVIMSERTKRDRARCLLDTLAMHSNASYDSFVNVLRKDYNWLADLLEIGNVGVIDGETHSLTPNNSYYDALALGDMPRLPPHYIPRDTELELIQSKLYGSQRNHYIVLHGMPGSGKSCLCTAALNDPHLLRKEFKNRVYWINVAEIRTSADILTHLNRLYKKLSIELNELEKRPHSTTYPLFDDVDMLKFELRRILLSTHFYDCLIVLDDVTSPTVFKAFDLGSKCLITTREKHIIQDYTNSITFISLTRGFTPFESLKLFSKCTGINISNLPQDAQIIHRLCKGAPIIIALIGSILQSSQDKNDDKNDCWKYCIDKLTNKEFSLKNYQKSEQEKLFNTMRMCIDSLSLELRGYYKSLAIFVEDLNIMPDVLQVMWKLKKYPVEEIMTELKNKSLVVSKYDKDLRVNVYGIHDLLLTYLKSQISKSEKLQMHYDLIMNYYEKSGENFAKLPNDNYIYSYIAYHLTEAQLWSKFAFIYYDLDFIAAKIRAVGSLDLLSDYSRFKKYICQDSPESENRLEELKDFVRIHGHNIGKYVNTDIVQYALQQAPSSFLYQQAIEMIKDRPSNLYFNFQQQKENVYYTHTLDLQEEVCSACFTNDTNHILVGTSFGQINLWEQEYKRILCTFRGHAQKITYIELSPDAGSFLSVSADGTVKLWPLDDTCTTSNGNVFDAHGFPQDAPSPRFKQENWHNFFESNHWIDVSQTFMILDREDYILSASFSYDNNSIVTGSQKGFIEVWNIETHEVTLTIKTVLCEPVKCVIFSLDDSLIISSMSNQVSLYNSKNGEFLSSFCTNAEPSRLLVIPFADNSLVVINKQEIAVWSWERDYCEKGVLIKEPTFRIMDQPNESQYLCGAITCDGQFVVSGSSDSTIRMWNIETGQIVKELRNNDERVICLDTFWNEDESAMHILLSGSDDQTVKQWHVEPVELKVNRRPIKLLPIFSTYWPPGSSLPYLAVVDNENRLRVMCGHNLISETEFRKEKILSIAFAHCGTKIALGLENGRVEQFDYQTRKLVPIMDLHAPIQYLEYLEETTISENGGCHIINHQKTKSNDELSSSLILPGATVTSSASTTLLSKRRNGSLKINLIKNQCLVASSNLNSSFMIHRNQKSLLLSKPKTQKITTSDDKSSIDEFDQNPIVKCFMLKTIMKILSISRNRTLKIWDMDSGHFSVLEDSPSSTVFVQSVALAADESMISLALSNCEFQIFKLTIPTTFQKLENVQSALYQNKKLQTSIHSCDFSSDVSILALGLDNGQILLWSILNSCECRYLKLHRSPVKYLSFASFNDPLVLVSVSEQIVWWNIKNSDLVPKNAARFKRRSLTSSMIRKENGTMTKSDSFWKSKCADDKTIMSAIKLRGPHASQLSVNNEFNSFFTIDVHGYVYFLNVLK